GLGRLPALEEDHRRNREHLEASRRLRVLVDVQLDDPQLRALGGDLLEYRGDDAAGTAPGRPEVDEHRPFGLENLGVEIGVCDLGEGACHCDLLVSFPITIQNEGRVLEITSRRWSSLPRSARSAR